MDNAFLGKNGHTWWIGVVEDNKDPLRVYRCRIRIFGWHTEDKNLIPTEDLPWAQATLPVNNSLSFSVPQIGEWVIGHFLDGESGQFPIYTGILPGVISPNNIKNPNKGFNSAQTKGPSPAITTQAKDGSGSSSKSEEFVSFPKASGIPTTNLEAMHLEFAKPQSFDDKLKEKVNDILGPKAQPLGDKLTAAATAVASASPPPTSITPDGKVVEKKKCGPDENSLIKDIGKLITDSKTLLADTEKFINSEIESAAASAASSLGITSGLNTISGAIDSASKALSDGLDTMKAAAEKELAEQKVNLEATARKYEKMAKESLNKTINDLSLESGSIGCYILGSIDGIAPASITTKLPVVVDSKTKTSKAVVGATTYPVPVPNPLPAAIPLPQIPSAHTKSSENTVTIWKAGVKISSDKLGAAYTNSAAGVAGSSTEIVRYTREMDNYYKKISEISSTYNDSTLKTELVTYWNKCLGTAQSKNTG